MHVLIAGNFKFIKKVFQSKTLLTVCFIHWLQYSNILSVLWHQCSIIAYCSTLLEMVEFSVKEAIWFAALPSFLNLVSKVLSTFTIERIGRRNLLLHQAVLLFYFLVYWLLFCSLVTMLVHQ